MQRVFDDSGYRVGWRVVLGARFRACSSTRSRAMTRSYLIFDGTPGSRITTTCNGASRRNSGHFRRNFRAHWFSLTKHRNTHPHNGTGASNDIVVNRPACPIFHLPRHRTTSTTEASNPRGSNYGRIRYNVVVEAPRVHTNLRFLTTLLDDGF